MDKMPPVGDSFVSTPAPAGEKKPNFEGNIDHDSEEKGSVRPLAAKNMKETQVLLSSPKGLFGGTKVNAKKCNDALKHALTEMTLKDSDSVLAAEDDQMIRHSETKAAKNGTVNSSETIISKAEVEENGKASELLEVAEILPEASESAPKRSCPICLTGDHVFLVPPCGHACCEPCMIKVLRMDGEQRWPPVKTPLPPTVGACPMCRTEVSAFQCQVADDGGAWSLAQTGDATNFRNALRDSVYVRYATPQTGHLSWHMGTMENNDIPPYLDVSRCKPDDDWQVVIRDNTTNKLIRQRLTKIHLDPGSLFVHKATRTLHGTITFGASNRLRNSHKWQVLLGFSADYRLITSGRIIELNDSLIQGEEDPVKAQIQYPLDGEWTISWDDGTGNELAQLITVRNNSYYQGKWGFHLHFERKKGTAIRCYFYWPRTTTVQEITLDDMEVKPGQKIEWSTSDARHNRVIWTRKTVDTSKSGPNSVLLGTDGDDATLYQRWITGGPEQPVDIVHFPTKLWGNVFCKRLTVGKTSYHFISPTDSYISFEHAPTRNNLPPLDDGMPMPTRMPMRNVRWNPDRRTLSATIEWQSDLNGVTWNDNVRWHLDSLRFDSRFVTILSGDIRCEWSHERRAPPRYRPPPPASRPKPVAIHVPKDPEKAKPTDRNEEWKMSGYGYDQIYLNAGIIERYRVGGSDFRSDLADDGYGVTDSDSHRLQRICRKVCRRLKSEGATDRTCEAINDVFYMAFQHPNSSPISFLHT